MARGGRHAAPRRRRVPPVLGLVAAGGLTVTVVASLSLTRDAGESATADVAETGSTATQEHALVGPSPIPVAATPSGPAYPSGFDLHAHSSTRADSLWVVVNKAHALSPEDYAPSLAVVGGKEVATALAPALQDLLDAASAAGAPLRLISGYRSFGYQAEVYSDAVAAHGRPDADRLSARPGHSEHQTGLAVDVDDAASTGGAGCQLSACFAHTDGGRWIAAHAGEYGFLVRYTRANSAVTGYDPEPWHLRYVGTDLTHAMAQAGLTTLEEVFGISGGRYPDEDD